MSFFDKMLNGIQSVPGFGIESTLLRKGGDFLDRVENSSIAAGELGAMGPVALLVEPKILKTVATGSGPSPIVISPNLGPKGLLTVSEVGAMGPATLLVKPSLIKTAVSGEGPTPSEQPHLGGAILRHAADASDTIRGSAVAAGIIGAMGPGAYFVDSDIHKAVVGLHSQHNYGKPQP